MILIPPEWIENSIENYIYHQTTKSQVVYWIVLATIALTIVLLPFIYVDVSVQSLGMVRPITETTEIKATVSEIISEVYVHEGQKVKKGELLLRFRSSSPHEKIQSQEKLLSDLNAHISDLQILATGKMPDIFKSPTRLQEYHLFTNKKKELQVGIDKAKRELDREKILYDKNLVSREEYEQYLYAYQSKVEEQSSLIKTQLSTWQTDLNNYQNQQNEVQAELKRETWEMKDLYEVHSPINGTIEQFSGIYSGNSVQAGQTIATISPDSTINIEAYVSPNNIGYITVGMPIKAQITSFNYNEWGMLNGNVVYVSSDCITNEKGETYFKVKCQLEQNYLVMKRTGAKGYIKKGMSAQVRFMITRRSLFDLLYQNIDEWINPTQLKWQQ